MDHLTLSQEIYTVPFLQQLLKSWQELSSLRVMCMNFSHADIFINFMGTDISPKVDVTLQDLVHLMNKPRFIEKEYFSAVWDKPFSFEAVELAVNSFSDETQKFSFTPAQKQILLEQFTLIHQTDHDPMIKAFFMRWALLRFIKDQQNLPYIVRIFDSYMLHTLGYLERPIVYHIEYAKLNVNSFLSQENISERTIFYLIQQIEHSCLLGTKILKIYAKNLEEIQKRIPLDPYVNKIFMEENLFIPIFENMILTITKIMTLFNWKRDKATRLLGRLCKIGMLVEVKMGKDKYFINNIVLQSLIEIRANPEVKKMIFAIYS